MNDPLNEQFYTWQQSTQRTVEAAVGAALPTEQHIPVRLHQAMRYACLGGGKRTRPLLSFAAGELTDAPAERCLVVAVSVELIHAYSLVHDDLPCMDDDQLRRGKPTCHIAYDEATALLVGDGLQALAFAHLSTIASLMDHNAMRLMALLANASGSLGMVGGQAIDCAAVGHTLNQTELSTMHRMKTGALIAAAIKMGAYCGRDLSPEESLALDQFAEGAGLLFQVVDDILDTSASTDVLGKTAGKDAAQNKPTYVSLLGLEGAQQYAEQIYQQATQNLAIFGATGQRLQQMTAYICHRSY